MEASIISKRNMKDWPVGKNMLPMVYFGFVAKDFYKGLNWEDNSI
jgi:hypothetical protein